MDNSIQQIARISLPIIYVVKTKPKRYKKISKGVKKK